MKTAKRVLAIVLSVMMIVGTCVIAASAADTLQAQINGGATEITLTKDTYETITVNGDLTINLNGYRLLSNLGSSAIRVNGGTVTITDGQVISRYKNVPSAQMLQEVWSNSPSAIRVNNGAKVILDGVRVVGGMVRVPTTTDYFVPSGSGIQLLNGSTATIKRSSIYGDYGVNNRVTNNTAGGDVTVEDTIILAYTMAVKGGKDTIKIAEGSEEIIAADRIVGVLNDGIRLEAGEKKLIKNVFDERVLIVSKTADQLTEELGKETPVITVTEGEDLATVEASELDYTWPNTKGTDCSYTLVPEGVKLSNGTEAALDAVDANLVDEDAQIRYRVEYKISDEAKPYILSLLEEGEDNPLDGCLAWAGAELDKYYAQVVNNPATSYVDSYQELIKEFGKLWYDIDSIGSQSIPGTNDDFASVPEFNRVRQMLVKLGGKVAYEADSRREFGFNDTRYKYYFGDNAAVPADGMYGLLDRVEALRVQLENIIGGSFTNTSTWGTLAAWAYDNYEEVIDIVYDLQDLLEELDGMLKEDMYKAIVNAAGADDYVDLLAEGMGNLAAILDMYEKALGIPDVNAALDTVERNKSLIKPYTDKIVSVINNWRTYVTPEKFIIDNELVKTYSTLGTTLVDRIEAGDKLHITVFGEGGVAYSGGTLTTGTTFNTKDVDFVDTFTLTAVTETEDVEFLFWINTENGSNRIVSTEPTFTMNTNYSRSIEAVFGYVEEPVAYFTNITGDIAGGPVNIVDAKVAVTSDIARPYVAGYAFQGWPGVADGAINASLANTAYFAGSSAFADPNAYYGPDGAILKINPGTNSLIVTPTYSLGGPYQIKFVDLDGEIYTADEAMYSDVVSFTSSFSNVYWKDGDNIVCVTPNYNYQVIKEATFTAVEGPCPVDTVARVSGTLVKDGVVTFYVERSTTKAIKTTGIVYSYENTLPVLDGENCKKATAKYNTQTGLYAPGFRQSSLEGKTLYIRAYIEFANGDVYYTPTAFEYPG